VDGGGKGMRKADIANEIFKQVGVSKNDAADIVELVLNLLKGVLQKGDAVKIAGFGNFVVRSKGAARDGTREPEKKSGLLPVEWSRFGPVRCLKSTSIPSRYLATSTSSMRTGHGE
jgi:integration host factor subunit alpha